MDFKELQNLIYSAIQHHNESLLDDLLDGEQAHRIIDTPGEDGNMPLHSAVLENDHLSVDCLLKHGANPNVFDTNRARTPLHLAVELNYINIVKLFLQLEYINLDLRDDRNLTCSEIAQFCDNISLAKLLENRQDDLDKIRENFYSSMNNACSNNDLKLAKDILGLHKRRILGRLPEHWSGEKVKRRYVENSLGDLINWSTSSWNDVTVLFKSASLGFTDICALLIEHGASAKGNENTNYSPLYVAAYGGFTDTVKLLLDRFPFLVHETTIEKWTVLHACCLQGHSETAKLLLSYEYPKQLLSRFISKSGLYEYEFAFDLNAQDAAGQTVIYLTVSANDEKLLDTLLQFSVEAKILKTTASNQSDSSNAFGTSLSRGPDNTTKNLSTRYARIIPDRPKSKLERHSELNPRASNQLDRILRQLKKIDIAEDIVTNLSNSDSAETNNRYLICPFELDLYCDYNSKTALHLAVCQQYHAIATTLLVNGSNPNLPILSRDTIKSDFTNANTDTGLNWLKSSKSTCLKEASKLNDESMCDILMRYGASDNPDNLALKVAASLRNNNLISKFLSLKSNVDPEFRINKKCNVEFASRYKQSQRLLKIAEENTTTTFSSMFPSAPVMVDWQNLKCIKTIDPQWLIEASLVHNKRLKHSTTSLIAITRLDLSSNNHKSIHPVIFRLPSLRELNLSDNRIESLINNSKTSITGENSAEIPTTKLIESHRVAMRRSKSSTLSSVNLESSNLIDLNEPQEWDLPYLEVLDLHNNRLISLPDCLFELPRLSELDVSSNQIRQLPWCLWRAPNLKEVIASGNLLDDLPKLSPLLSQDSSFSSLKQGDYLDSPKSERNSTTGTLSPDKPSEPNLSSLEFVCSSRFDNSYPDSARRLPIGQLELPIQHFNHWQEKVDLVSDLVKPDDDDLLGNQIGEQQSKLTYLNLSHNSFELVPEVLSCLAPELVRLNLSYNRLKDLGPICKFPAKLKNLDLSNNQICDWFNLSSEPQSRVCFACIGRRSIKYPIGVVGTCAHKAHHKLDCLKSINLSYNQLKDIKLISLDSKSVPQLGNDNIRGQLLYPNITVLDLAYNKIAHIPKNVFHLKDLSVLNLTSNVNISTLPAELGLATKLWNLAISGCNLNEPLKSIVGGKNFKTMDVIGYLRSILDEAKSYARMKLMLVGLQGIGKTSLLEQMRAEGTSGLRRRAPEHWTKRMGHSTRSNLRNQKGVTLSTVGVDIHDWTFCKRVARNQPNHGPVSFSTWDFGGQQEFYATHRYFLSRRSMYLVVWRLTDGIEGILGIQQWLVNIQSRAPGSPVIIVGTHEDIVEGGEEGTIVRNLQAEVHRQFIDITDHDKCGLPRVMDAIVVSTKTKLNIRNLCNRIYDVVFSLRCPGGTERLLEQKIPATYLYLEEIISWIVHDRQQKKLEPVLTYDEYRRTVSEQLASRYQKTFRELEPLNSKEINYNSELQQATRFLHENGVLLHYEDTNLRDLYFLDPQWLCDILSHVVTIREINPHVKNGLMKISDLTFLFKNVSVSSNGGIQPYVVNLLNKFEVALTWNSQYLLIPSLLPSKPEDVIEQQDFQAKIAPRVRGRSAVRRFDLKKGQSRSSSIDPLSASARKLQPGDDNQPTKSTFLIDQRPEEAIYRFVLLRYLPAGFISRLQSGILSDPTYDDLCADLQAHFLEHCDEELASYLNENLGRNAGWTCWKAGIRLTMQSEVTINGPNEGTNLPHLMSIQELSTLSLNSLFKGKDVKVESQQARVNTTPNNSQPDTSDPKRRATNLQGALISRWCKFDTSQYSNVIVLSVPNWRLKILDNLNGTVKFIEPDAQIIAKLLSNSVDHIDNLLEDWYPSLGTRFAHTLGGSYLVTRLVPCNKCFVSLNVDQDLSNTRASRASMAKRYPNRDLNFRITSQDSQQVASIFNQDKTNETNTIYFYYVEYCIFSAFNQIVSSQKDPVFNGATNRRCVSNPIRRSGASQLICPRHGQVPIRSIAPDIVFDDVPDCYKIENDQIERCKLIGRGTFGFVFKGSLQSSFPLNQLGQANQEVALKLLQPVDPGPEADQADAIAFHSAQSNWIREPFQSACRSYCTARHEVNILQTLSHPNIVLFIGLCTRPLALVLELAPLGCLCDQFKSYKRAGMRIDKHAVQKTIVQVAKALEFLHQQRIIYRDLKAENVLVWSFPSPFATQARAATVELKLADYGISRQALSTGIWKGFAGTINFLAPEILRHNGDEEYTEKVDCFSFGIFLYELLTLRSPFKHNEAMKSHLADGARPSMSTRDFIYPSHMLDLMSACWSQEPHCRPTASQIVSIASTPEFLQLLDAVAFKCDGTACLAIQESDTVQFWLSSEPDRFDLLACNANHWDLYNRLAIYDDDNSVGSLKTTCCCLVGDKIWACDSRLTIHVWPIGSLMISQSTMASRQAQNTDANQEPATSSIDAVHQFPLNLKRPIGQSPHVKQMIFVERAKSLVLLLSNGNLWLYSLDSKKCQQVDDGAIQFGCMACPETSTISETRFELYCGQSNGISYLEISEMELHRQSILPLAGSSSSEGDEDLYAEGLLDPELPDSEVTNIVASGHQLWTSTGSTVHQWDLKQKCVTRKLECWKLVPCSESLESINIESYYQEARSSRVSSFVHLNDQLFVGTTHGCFMIVEASTLKPMIVFRPYEANLRILTPCHLMRESHDTSQSLDKTIDSQQSDQFLITIGTGYRDLMRRYVTSLNDQDENAEQVAVLWSADYKLSD